ncbi:hypothetical protein POM88_053442 [Heracleum sosnowskyi]|uniref:Cystatin domain-containing protein n=1 Tax=Heracleum sosnowskyi TaxID=360622 RepID=A0AAD8GPD6_9APIA|nr:hypothetical protein POM88_053442 [Heracleum sosnowskyi]
MRKLIIAPPPAEKNPQLLSPSSQLKRNPYFLPQGRGREMSWFKKLKSRFSTQKERSRHGNVEQVMSISALGLNQYYQEPQEEDDGQNPYFKRSRSMSVHEPQEEDDGRIPYLNWGRSMSVHEPQEEDDGRIPYLNRGQSMSVHEPQEQDDSRSRSICHRSQIKELNKNRDRNRNPDPKAKRTRPGLVGRDELIRVINQMKTRKVPEDYEYNYEPVELTREDDGIVYIEEALKGAKMNRTWKQKIFSQRLEDDDEELRKQIDDRLKHYHPDIAHEYWVKERYSILERRQYDRDVSTTQGFEVGYYPYLMRNCGSLIIRYYCPPDANLSDDAIADLYGLANHAIQFYNSAEQTNYSVVKVIKTMTIVAGGTWYYMTFQASIPCYGDNLWTFEAKLFESIPCPEPYIKVGFVRLKMRAASSLIEEPYAANSILPQACCSSSSSFYYPFAGQ